MRRIYVDITDVSDSVLEFLGYSFVAGNDGFKLYNNKGDAHIVHIEPNGKKYIYVEDINDAHALAHKHQIVIPSQ